MVILTACYCLVKQSPKFDTAIPERYNECRMSEEKPLSKHYVIGLTGNIGAGKSMVRRMLQHLGAYGIDMDIITREILNKSGPAKDQVIARFGDSIIDSHGSIDRAKLADIVFNDSCALADLEKILHPLVSMVGENLIRHARLPIVVIEAIKLLDSDLAGKCDCIWVVDADKKVAFQRLVKQRGMGHSQINKRLSKQSPSEEKKVVIDNSKGVKETWHQVVKSWEQMKKDSQDFSACVTNTLNKLAFLGERLVTPASKWFSELQKFITPSHEPDARFFWAGNPREQSSSIFEWPNKNAAQSNRIERRH